MPKKKPVKQAKKKLRPSKHNYEELTAKAISFLALNEGKSFGDFCRSEKLCYEYLRTKLNLEKIFDEANKLKAKKSEEILKATEKELKKEGKKEALSYINEIRQNKSFIGLIVNKIIKKDKEGKQLLDIGFNSAGEALRCINEFNKTNILLDEKLRENKPLEIDEDKKEAKQRRDSRLDELIEFQKEKNDNTNKDITDNGNTETPTN